MKKQHDPKQTTTPNELGKRLASYRKDRGMNQTELAIKAHVVPNAVFKIECGQTKNPTSETVSKLEDALGLPRGVLLGAKFDQAELKKAGQGNTNMKEARGIPDSLLQFVASEDGKDLTGEEIECLTRTRGSNGEAPTIEAYKRVLWLVRNVKKLPG